MWRNAKTQVVQHFASQDVFFSLFCVFTVAFSSSATIPSKTAPYISGGALSVMPTTSNQVDNAVAVTLSGRSLGVLGTVSSTGGLINKFGERYPDRSVVNQYNIDDLWAPGPAAPRDSTDIVAQHPFAYKLTALGVLNYRWWVAGTKLNVNRTCPTEYGVFMRCKAGTTTMTILYDEEAHWTAPDEFFKNLNVTQSGCQHGIINAAVSSVPATSNSAPHSGIFAVGVHVNEGLPVPRHHMRFQQYKETGRHNLRLVRQLYWPSPDLALCPRGKPRSHLNSVAVHELEIYVAGVVCLSHVSIVCRCKFIMSNAQVLDHAGARQAGSGTDILTNGGADAVLAKLKISASGTLAVAWMELLGGGKDDVAHAVAVSSNGTSVFIAGSSEEDPSMGLTYGSTRDMVIAKYRASGGTRKWAMVSGRPKDDVAYAITVDSAGAIYAAGVCGQASCVLGIVEYKGAAGTSLRRWTGVSSQDVITAMTSLHNLWLVGNVGTDMFIGRQPLYETALLYSYRKFKHVYGKMGVAVRTPQFFVAEPKIKEVFQEAIGNLSNTPSDWVHNLTVKLTTTLPLVAASNSRRLSNDNVRVDWVIEIPDDAPENVTVTLIADTFDAQTIADATRSVMDALALMSVGVGYNPEVTWKYNIAASSPTPAPSQSESSSDYLWLVWTAVAVSLANVFGVGFCAYTFRRKWLRKHGSTKDWDSMEAKVLTKAEIALLKQCDYKQMLDPPQAISSGEEERMRRFAQAMRQSSPYDCKVALVYNVSQRSEDEKGCGPGLFYAIAVMKYLHDHGIQCFCDLMIPKEVPREAFEASLSSRFSKCKMVIVLQTKSLYKSRSSLQEIYTACKNRMELFPLRCEEELVKAGEEWPQIDGKNVEDMIMVHEVQQKFCSLNSTPSPPYTILNQPAILADVVTDVKIKIGLQGSNDLQVQSKHVPTTYGLKETELDPLVQAEYKSDDVASSRASTSHLASPRLSKEQLGETSLDQREPVSVVVDNSATEAAGADMPYHSSAPSVDTSTPLSEARSASPNVAGARFSGGPTRSSPVRSRKVQAKKLASQATNKKSSGPNNSTGTNGKFKVSAASLHSNCTDAKFKETGSMQSSGPNNSTGTNGKFKVSAASLQSNCTDAKFKETGSMPQLLSDDANVVSSSSKSPAKRKKPNNLAKKGNSSTQKENGNSAVRPAEELRNQSQAEHPDAASPSPAMYGIGTDEEKSFKPARSKQSGQKAAAPKRLRTAGERQVSS